MEKDTPRELMKNRMWKKHLLWIIPLCLLIGFGIGYYWLYNVTLIRNLTWYKCCLEGMLK